MNIDEISKLTEKKNELERLLFDCKEAIAKLLKLPLNKCFTETLKEQLTKLKPHQFITWHENKHCYREARKLGIKIKTKKSRFDNCYKIRRIK